MKQDPFFLGYHACKELLLSRLAEPAPGRIQLLAGPRQVGKTTLLLELRGHFGEESIYMAADSPEAALPGFWERVFGEAEETAKSNGRAIVFLDEVHVLSKWAEHLKGITDGFRRRRIPVHTVATGSSALKLAFGSRETLAGRFERITLTHWSANSLAQAFEFKAKDAVNQVVGMGSYPGAVSLQNDVRRWSAYIRDAIVEPAIGRDILALSSIRKPALLRQVFGVAASSPAQIVSLQKIQGQLQDPGALETIAHYLSLLEEAFLIAPISKYANRSVRRRSSPPKLVTLNNAILAVMDPQGIPTPDSDPERFGLWVENACLAFAWNVGQHVSYWRGEPQEIDGVFEGSWGKWAVEIKTKKLRLSDLRAVLEFTRRNPSIRPLVICRDGDEDTARQAGVAAVGWPTFLLSGPPRRGIRSTPKA